MTDRQALAGCILAFVSLATPDVAEGQPLPSHGGRPIVATIGEDVIPLDEFARQLGPAADRARLAQGRSTAEELELLERLVTIRLIAQEAGRMGLDTVPEIAKQVEVSAREILREVLIERLVKDVVAPPAAVDKIYRDAVREWKTATLVFQKEDLAEQARKALAGGAPFTKIADAAVAAKTARLESDPAFHGKKDYLPQIAAAIAPLRAGAISPVIRLPAGFVVVHVLDVRYPENPEARADAREQVLRQKQIQYLRAHEQALRKRYVVVNTALLDSIDYAAAGPDLAPLLADTRVIARIKGAVSVTVGDLTDYLRFQYFHGSDQKKQRADMNAKKADALDATLGRRLLNMEAYSLGIDRTPTYRDRLKGYRESLVFDSFIQKVIVPENRLKEGDLLQHYKDHPADYAYPAMIKARGVAFMTRTAAEAALGKLREGTDFDWLAANAAGRAAAGEDGALALDGRPVTIDSMPKGVQAALSDVKAGDVRLYEAPGGRFHVVAVQQVIPSTAKPYDEVREAIASTVYSEKIKNAVEGYARKLRGHVTVRTYLARGR
jgi:hypothetical protein